MVLRGGVGCIFREERSCTGVLFWEHRVYLAGVSYCVPSRLVSALLMLITIDFSLASLERFQNAPSLICILPSSLKERDVETIHLIHTQISEGVF